MTRAGLNSSRPRRSLVVAGVLVAIIGTAAVLSMPVTTRQGVDFSVSTYRIPLYLKAISFIDRNLEYRRLAHHLTSGMTTDQDKVLALFTWTRDHIRPTPPGLPVVDDHIWHIIIRGYGEADQVADVFTTIATYAGIPAFWEVVELPAGPGKLVLSFAKVEGRWAMFDVVGGVAFADPQGRLLDAQELLTHPEALGAPYREYIEHLQRLEIPAVLRAQKQMPWPRFVYEVKRRLYLVDDAEARQRHAQPRLVIGAAP